MRRAASRPVVIWTAFVLVHLAIAGFNLYDRTSNPIGDIRRVYFGWAQQSFAGTVVGIDTVLENRVLLGSVNAHRRDWEAGVHDLVAMRERWPDALEHLVGLRVTPDRFADAFAFRGVKATLQFA